MKINEKIALAACFLGLFGFGTNASAFDFESKGIYYNVISETEKSISVTSNETDSYTNEVTIPSEVSYNGKTYTVKGVEESAFADCSSLVSVNLPATIETIGESAFSDCKMLKNIVIPNSVKNIGDYAFWNCSALESVVLPNNVNKISDGVFFGCTSLSLVSIPASVSKIGACAFYRCSSLTSIVIPNSVSNIGTGAFEGCTSLCLAFDNNSVAPVLGEDAFSNISSTASLCVSNELSLETYKNEGFDNFFKSVVTAADNQKMNYSTTK